MTVSRGTVASTDLAKSTAVVGRANFLITGSSTFGDVATSAYEVICFAVKLDPCARSDTDSPPATAKNRRVVAVYLGVMAKVMVEATAKAVSVTISTLSQRRRRMSR